MVPWSKYIDVCMCVPTSVSFVHLSIIGSLLSFRYRQKRCYFIRPWSPTTHRLSIRSWWLCVQRPFIVNTMAVVGIPEYPSDVSCNFDVVSYASLIVYDSTGQERCHRTTYCIYWRSLYSGCQWSGAWSPEMFTTSMERWCTDWWGWIMTN